MSKKFLHRDDSPFGDGIWQKIDETVAGAAKSQLGVRRLVHTQGPYGLGLKALASGDRPAEEKEEGEACLSTGCVTPLTMIQKNFTLPVRDVAAFEQSGMPLDMGAAARAAMACAREEDNLLLYGSKALGLEGLMNLKGAQSIKLQSWNEVGTAAEDMIKAVTAFDKAGYHGPYGLGLAPALYNGLFRRYPQGNQTELEHLGQMITEGIVKMASITNGGVLMHGCCPLVSIVIGQDLMTGFVGPAGSDYEFTVFETVALRVQQADTICVLKS